MNDASRPEAAHAQRLMDDNSPVGVSASATAELLCDVARLLRRYVVMSDEQLVAVALWTLHTHAFEAAHATPYLSVQSAEKRSGKTRLIEVLELLVRGAWRVASASEAALFRKIASHEPTLLLDEVDAIFGSRSERTEPLRAILNAGNRPGASVARCVGEGANQTVADFSVYCPKLLAGIDTGRLPDTIADRSIKIEMKRKTKGEAVERFYVRDAEPIADSLRERLAEWAQANTKALRDARPRLPDELSDRAGEAWEPLFAIADLADGDWPQRAQAAAIALSSRTDEPDSASRGTLLLVAVRRAFADRDVMPTEDILKAINADDDLPYGGWRDGKGLDARGLARELRPYAIRSASVRVGDRTPKGYRRADFEDAWARYPPPSHESPPRAPQAPRATEPPHEHARDYWDVADVADVADYRQMGAAPVAPRGNGNVGSTEPSPEMADAERAVGADTFDWDAELDRLRAKFPDLGARSERS